jgi:membrane protein EpsK
LDGAFILQMDKTNEGQICKNLTMNVFSFMVNLFSGLWLVPYLIKNLGVAAYGLVPLAVVFTENIGIITNAWNVASTRFLVISFERDDDNADVIFNSSLIFMSLLVVLQLLVLPLIIKYFYVIVTIPVGFYEDAVFLFVLTVIGFSFSLLGTVFSTSMFSKNRIDLMRLNDVIKQIIRITIIVICFLTFGPKLIYVGIANLVGGVSDICLGVLRCRQLTPSLSISPFKSDFKRIQPLIGMAGWILVNTLGYLFFLRMDIYLVNLFIGAKACGEYSAVLQWSLLIRTAAVVFSGVVAPLGLIYYSRGEFEKLAKMMCLSVKIISVFFAVPLGFLCCFSSDVLAVWLGADFRALGGLLFLQLCMLVLNIGVLPLFAVASAANRVKAPALVNFFMGFINLVLAWWVVTTTDWGYYGIAFIGVTVLTLKNAVFTSLYSAYILNLPRGIFIKRLLCGLLAFSYVYIFSSILGSFFRCESLISLGLGFLVVFSATFLPLLWVVFTREERLILADIVPAGVKKTCRKMLLVAHQNITI